MRAAKRDYYEVLGVERTVDDAELKAAYRKLAIKHHPDRNPGDPQAEDAFKELTEAYAVLSDSDKRRRYDHVGHAAFSASGGAPDLSSIGDILENFFEDVFGRRGGAGLPKDKRYTLEINFEEAAHGVEKRIEYERIEPCERCHGERAEPGVAAPECPACHGRGVVRYQRGFFAASRPCSTCEGSGVRADVRCTRCHGSGGVAQTQVLSVKVPAGVEDGAVRTVRGAGDHTSQGTGDLTVHIRVRPHALFVREGADLLCEVPVSFPQAALGSQIDVPTLEGKVTMRLPAGTPSGKVFRLRGKGFPVFGGYGKGDQLVTVVVEVPQMLSPRQRELLEALSEALDSEPGGSKRQGFLDKLKQLFD